MARAFSVSATGQLHTGDCVATGWQIGESAVVAAVAEVKIYAGTGTSGQLLAHVHVAADGSAAGDFGGPDGVYCSGGVHVELVSGTADVIVYVR